MNLGIASYITSAGLKAVTSAGVLGPYFAIKYFLPIYDYRIDKTICREISGTTSATSISALNLVSATSSNLFGEKIYADGIYDVSKNSFLYWNSAMGSLPDGINRNVISQQSVSTDVNLFSGKPLSIVVSGSSFMSSATGRFDVSGTHLVSGAELATYNPLSASIWPTSAFYRVAGYSPNVNGLTSATGTYKCRIPPSNSSFKFNGLALYAVKVDGNGFDDYGNGTTFGFNPTLFSVVLFDQAQYKESDVGGVNDFEISVDLGFDWNVISSSTSAVPRYIETNSWIKVPTSTSTSAYALNYDGDIVISSSAVAGSYAPKAKLTVTDPYKQQLRLANDNDRFTDFRTIRFANDLSGPVPKSNNRAVLSIDTSCPDDSLLQLGYKTSAVGIKSLAIGCYSSAVGYLQGPLTDFSDTTPVDNQNVTNSTGGYTVAIGVKNYSEGFGSVSFGYQVSSIGYLNFAGGESSVAKYGEYNLGYNDRAGLNFAYGKEVSAISRINQYASFEYTGSDVLADDESYGSNIAFGVRSLSNGGLSFVNGAYVSAYGVNAFGLGYKNLAQGHFSFVGGINSSAMSDMNFVFGDNVNSMSPFGFAYGKNIVLGGNGRYSSFNVGIGQDLSATGDSHAFVLGRFAIANGLNSFAYGQNYDTIGQGITLANGLNSIAIGHNTSALTKNSLAIGETNLSTAIRNFDEGSISIGYKNISTGYYSVSIGEENYSENTASFAAGGFTSAVGNYSTSLGYKSKSSGDYSLSFGEYSTADGRGSVAGGFSSSATGSYSFAIGNFSKATKDYSVAIGYAAESNHENSIAIGNNARTTSDKQIMIGACDDTVVINGSNIRIGDGCSSTVTIPGISQFNDSISLDINFTGPNDGSDNSWNKRTLSVDYGRTGFTNKTITLLETGYNTCIFQVTNINGDFYAWSRANNPSNTSLNKLALGSSITVFTQVFNTKSFVLGISLDKVLNSIIFVGPGVTNPASTIQYSDYLSLDRKLIFTSICNKTSHQGTEEHNAYWQQNVNIFNVKVDYDKPYLNHLLNFNTNKSFGDGLCAYNIFARSIGEFADLRVVGSDYGLASYNTLNSESIMFQKNRIPDSGGNSSLMTGMFVNSSGKCIVLNNNSDIGI